jgi:SAM-dependent methyltransferase
MDMTNGNGLAELAQQYEDVCRSMAMEKDANTLREADDLLWGLTEQLCNKLNHAENSSASDFRSTSFKEKVLKWFVQHPQTARLWNKPAGYSGDYATIEWLCQNNQTWTCLEDIFSNHVLRCTMAKQHREKVVEQQAFFLSILSRSEDVDIADVGCGPSMALRGALALTRPKQARLVLVDLDPAALMCSQAQLAMTTSNIQFEYKQGDVVQTLRSFCKNAQRFDAITFGGLFDYLPNRVIVFVLQKSFTLLKAGGTLFFTQVTHANPDMTFMDWWGDWKLIQRDEEELLSLCYEARIPAKAVSMHRVPTNCALVVKIQADL